MSREERRQYERMMRGMERGPALPPAARARAERIAARRTARPAPSRTAGGAFSLRFMVVALLVAAAAGYLAFSLAFQQPIAPYVGLVVAAFVFAAAVGMRLLQQRAARRG